MNGPILLVDPTAVSFTVKETSSHTRAAKLPANRPTLDERVRITFVREQFRSHSQVIRQARGFYAATVRAALAICLHENLRLRAGEDRLTFRVRFGGRTILY